ncbi:MAG: 3-oxoacyl-[acyl-carrier-protein] reductase [Planctomycetota bacterium]|jgi:3-oxoacyl-[acyl-carrier protein] reductase
MSVTLDLAGQAGIVTGASRGIGRAIALKLAEAGAELALCARNEEALAGLVQEIGERFSRRAIAIPVDVTDGDAVEAAVKQTKDSLGRIDILVNNAGVTEDTLLARMSLAQWSKVIDTNLTGAFLFTRHATRTLMKQRYGRVINISSVVGQRGNAGQANYAASKAGLIGFTKSVARELASRGVTVNAVCPGFIATDMTAALTEEQQAAIAKAIPAGRVGKAEDIANVVLFLASRESAYVTGSCLAVDGGFAM